MKETKRQQNVDTVREWEGAFMIKEKPQAERPYEKCLEKGVKSLSDSELLAVILRSGTAGLDCVQMASEVLKRSKSVASRVDGDSGDRTGERSTASVYRGTVRPPGGYAGEGEAGILPAGHSG